MFTFLTAAGLAGSATPGAAHGQPDHGRKPRHGRRLLGFTPVPPSDADALIVPDGCTAEALVP